MTIEILTLVALLCQCPGWSCEPFKCQKYLIECVEKNPTAAKLAKCVKEREEK